MTIKQRPKPSKALRGRIKDKISGMALKTGVLGFTDFAGISGIQLVLDSPTARAGAESGYQQQ